MHRGRNDRWAPYHNRARRVARHFRVPPGGIRTTSAASPRYILAGKAVVAGSLVFAAGAVATAIAEVLTRHVLAANGIYLFPQSGLVVAQVIIGTGLFLGLAAVLVVALGTMLRHGMGTVVAGVVLLIVPGIIVTELPADSELASAVCSSISHWYSMRAV